MDEPQHGHSIRQHGCRASCSRRPFVRVSTAAPLYGPNHTVSRDGDQPNNNERQS
jgi:hypothetical protein